MRRKLKLLLLEKIKNYKDKKPPDLAWNQLARFPSESGGLFYLKTDIRTPSPPRPGPYIPPS